MPRRYIVVGSGVAGVSAAEVIRREDPLGHLTLIGDDPGGYYSRPGLAYFLTSRIPEQQLYPRPAASLRALFPNRVHARVTAVLPESHRVILADGRWLSYDRLLLATGSRCAPGDFPGNDLRGVVSLYTIEDVRRIRALARRGERAIVVGGGIIAVELAEGLAALDMHVHYLLRGERFWSSVLDEVESKLVEQGLERAGIRLHHKTQIAEALGQGGVLQGVVTRAGDRVRCRVLGVAIGVRANVDLAEGAGLATGKGILVNEYLETSADGIFAAGDVAQVRDPRTGDSWMETLWPTSRLQGRVAGLNMTGSHTVCSRPVAHNTVRIGGIITTTIGDLACAREPDITTLQLGDQELRRLKRMPYDVDHLDRMSRVRILLRQQHVIGAVVMGDQRPAYALRLLIEGKRELSSLDRSDGTSTHSVELLIANLLREEGSRVVRV